MKQTTFEQLQELAESFSHQGRKISPMQVAAELLERGLELVTKDEEEAGA
jgi:hypothetical protein